MKIYIVLTLNKKRVFTQIFCVFAWTILKMFIQKNTFSERLKYTVLLYEFFISSWK